MCLLLLWITFKVNKAASIVLHISYWKRQISVGVLFCCFLHILKRDCPDRQECRFIFTLWCYLCDLMMSFSILAVARSPSSNLVCTDLFFSPCLQTHGTQIQSFLMRVSKERINLLWEWFNVALQHTIWDHNVSLKCTFWILQSSSLWSSFTGQRQIHKSTWYLYKDLWIQNYWVWDYLFCCVAYLSKSVYKGKQMPFSFTVE